MTVRASRLLVLGIVVTVLVVAAVGLSLRKRLRCVGFAGHPVSLSELPQPVTTTGNLRLAAWNIRNFPFDERAQEPDAGFANQTNICDLEDALGGLDADVLGVEEIRDIRRFVPILQRAGRKRHYRAVFSAGGGRWGQHVGIAWDDRRLELVGRPVEIPQLAVSPSERPGLAAYLRSRTPEGIDLTVIQVHLAATPKGFETRREQYRALAQWVEEWVATIADHDVVVQGDVNTTGAKGGSVEEELALADQLLGTAGLRRLPNRAGCTEYWEGPEPADGVQIPALLDHVYVRGLQELDTAVPLEPWLHCRRAACGKLISKQGAEDATFWDVSDHCPLTYEVRDRDQD